MDGLENLLLTYAGAVLINTVLSAMLWYRERSTLNRSLFGVWASSLLTFGVQGAFAATNLQLVLGFSATFLIGAAIALLISEIIDVAVPWTVFFVLMGVAYLLTVVAYVADAPFAVLGTPVALAVSCPMIFVVYKAVTGGRWTKLSLAGKGLVVSIGFYILHALDFPLLRDKPEFAALGFTIAILIVFALSIFAPAVVLEIITASQARVAAEMEVAHRIQMEILPKRPEIEGLDLACYMRPAEEVGGDYYDIVEVGDTTWMLLGDVTGHGLSSGLVMLMAQSVISSILHTRPEIAPGELNYVANRILFQNLQRLGEQRSMTVVALRRVGEGNRFLYSGAHENLYVYRAGSGEVEVIDVEQLPHGLGMLDEFGRDEYTEAELALQAGDLLLVSTDGIREAARGRGLQRRHVRGGAARRLPQGDGRHAGRAHQGRAALAARRVHPGRLPRRRDVHPRSGDALKLKISSTSLRSERAVGGSV